MLGREPKVGSIILLLFLSDAIPLSAEPIGFEPRVDIDLTVLAPMEPSALEGLASIHADVPTSIWFMNSLQETVNVWWIDYSGNEVFYYTLGPLQSYQQLTYLTHPWLIRHQPSGTALVGFQPAPQAGVATIIDLSESPSPVPEPSTLLLLAMGIAGLTGRRLRRARYRGPLMR